MATTYWTGNGQAIAQTTTLTVTAAPAAGTLTATINGKSITYTAVSGDTTSTAANGWLALLQASTAPAEFGEITWTVSANVVTGTATVPGTPYTLSSSAGAGAAVTQATSVSNSSPNDVNNANNWLRSGSASLPQNGDDVVVQNSSVSLLWNLSSLSAVTFNSFVRWQSFTGTIGLPENNPLGYFEYRPTYFKFSGGGAGFTMVLGVGTTGTGPGRERYDLGAQQTQLVVLASGSALDDFSVRFLGTNASNAAKIVGTTVGIGMLPGEVSTLASASVDGGGSLSLGPGVTFSGTLALNSATGFLDCAPAAITLDNGAFLTVESTALTYTAVTVRSGSQVSWISNSTVTTLVLTVGSVFDASGDVRAMTITNSTIDADSCQIIDTNNRITYTNATTMNNSASTGPITFGTGRTVKVT